LFRENFHLRSGLALNLSSGVHPFPGSNAVSVNVPAEGSGVRGIWFGDPCTEAGFVGCIHFENASATMAERLPRLVNALAGSGNRASVDYRVIGGDAFYDTQDGNTTARFYRALTPLAQGVPEVSVLGNHDLWVAGSPILRDRLDPFGDGFVQYFAQDSLAATDSDDGAFLDLSVDPDAASDGASGAAHPERLNSIPAARNFLSYSVLGTAAARR